MDLEAKYCFGGYYMTARTVRSCFIWERCGTCHECDWGHCKTRVVKDWQDCATYLPRPQNSPLFYRHISCSTTSLYANPQESLPDTIWHALEPAIKDKIHGIHKTKGECGAKAIQSEGRKPIRAGGIPTWHPNVKVSAIKKVNDLAQPIILPNVACMVQIATKVVLILAPPWRTRLCHTYSSMKKIPQGSLLILTWDLSHLALPHTSSTFLHQIVNISFSISYKFL